MVAREGIRLNLPPNNRADDLPNFGAEDALWFGGQFPSRSSLKLLALAAVFFRAAAIGTWLIRFGAIKIPSFWLDHWG
jgi:hypothetical protein